MLEKIFTKLNLGESELKVYLSLFESGATRAGHLSKKIGIPRSSLYGFLNNLTEKGLVLQSEKENVKLWQAQPPEKVLELLNHKVDAWEQAKNNFEQFLPELRGKYATDQIAPHFNYFEGEEGVKHILKDMLLYRDIETQAFWPIKDMVDILSPEFFKYLNKRRIKNKLYTRAIWPADKAVDIKKHSYLGVGEKFHREIRVAPKGISCSMGYWVYGNKVAFISSRKESFGFIVESSEFVELLLTQFELIWNISKPILADLKHTESFLRE